MEFWGLLGETFLPFFIAFDPIGLLPIYLSLTYSMETSELRKVSAIAVLVAFGICVFFGFFGGVLLKTLGVTMADFQIAGGLLLIVLSILDSQSRDKARRRPESYFQVAVVPIAMPLLVGPAVLTTLLLSLQSVGQFMTWTALALNLFLVYLLFFYSKFVLRIIGKTGAKGAGKFFSILLCALGVMFIRKGIISILGSL